MISLEDEMKKAESIILLCERLASKGLLVDLTGLERIVNNIKTTISEDISKYSGFLPKINDINLSMDSLLKRANQENAEDKCLIAI